MTETDEDREAMIAHGEGMLLAIAFDDGEVRVGALHEAAHAVACVKLGRAIRYVTMRGRASEPGGAPVPRVVVYPASADPEAVRRRPERYRRDALIGIAGPMVECENAGVAGFRRVASQSDLDSIARYVDTVHQPADDAERDQIIDGLAAEVATLLDGWGDAIERVAQALQDRGRLSQAEVIALVE